MQIKKKKTIRYLAKLFYDNEDVISKIEDQWKNLATKKF
jgi:hypothetical protein